VDLILAFGFVGLGCPLFSYWLNLLRITSLVFVLVLLASRSMLALISGVTRQMIVAAFVSDFAGFIDPQSLATASTSGYPVEVLAVTHQ
jgi:hypothetical protein